MVEHTPTHLDPDIRAYYDRAPEESRLEHGAFQLEELRSRELILRHAPELPAVVLDIGGAAGAYAFWLADRGYEVRLFDAVARLVDVARERNEHAVHRLAACSVADARALPETNESAAMVLLLGPLYHLVAQRDLRREVIDAGFEVEGLYGVEGPGWILPDLVERWKDPERREIILQVARMLESESSVIGCSAHLIVVGRKPNTSHS